MEKLPLYVLANQEKKPLTDLLFWSEFKLGKFLLIVLADEAVNLVYPMVLLEPTTGQVVSFLKMPRTILAELANIEELSESAVEMIALLKGAKA
ncbi:MAG: hypothetical protein IT416_04245 [Candidatus Pacebacteria bacterium]|nr:hypothetical protein [Candidatus Paceibacterota bacterium]